MACINWSAVYRAFKRHPNQNKMQFYRCELWKFCDGELPAVKTFYNRIAEHRLQDQARAVKHRSSRNQKLASPYHFQSDKPELVNIAVIGSVQWQSTFEK